MAMQPMTGQAIQEGIMPHMGMFTNLTFGTEIIYSFIIIACSLMIYFGTKELYELSSHKGIKYFRLSFLFFALAYFSRSLIKLILTYFDIRLIFDIPRKSINPIIGQTTMFIFMYFSTMAILYLAYSVMYKKIKGKQTVYLLHLIAIITSTIIIILRNPTFYLTINIALLIIVIFTFQISKQSNKKTNLHTIYILLSVFWAINIIDILIPDFFQMFQLFIYLISSGIFLAMLYKVLKKTGSN